MGERGRNRIGKEKGVGVSGGEGGKIWGYRMRRGVEGEEV